MGHRAKGIGQKGRSLRLKEIEKLKAEGCKLKAER
jgi:hypothetical protein